MVSIHDVNACDILTWNHEFKSVSLNTRILPLSDDFIKYLCEDGIFLSSSHPTRDDLSDDSDLHSISDEATQTRDFPDFERQVNSAISELGGEVFVKLNWSAATDAVWVNGGSLKCRNFHDVVLLLKTSDKVMYDIKCIYNGCVDYVVDSSIVDGRKRYLVLKEWISIDPSMEFRLFIKNKRLQGISQRDCTTFYDFLGQTVSSIQARLQKFADAKLIQKFPLNSYTVDVFVTKGRVILLDFNVFGNPTQSLLFDWDSDFRIVNEASDSVEMRIVRSRYDIMASSSGSYRGPIDVAHAPDFSKFLDICKQQQQESSDSESDTH